MAGLLITKIERFIAESASDFFKSVNNWQTRWLSHALCAPGHHTAKRRRECTTQITTLVCDSCSFSDINVPQGSIATHTRCGGIFSKCFAANLLENLTVKNLENWLRINTVAAISLVSPVLEHEV